MLRRRRQPVRLVAAHAGAGLDERRRLVDRVGLRHHNVSDADRARDGAGLVECGWPCARADRGARDRQRRLYDSCDDRGRTARCSDRQSQRRVGRHRAAARAGRGRLKLDRQRRQCRGQSVSGHSRADHCREHQRRAARRPRARTADAPRRNADGVGRREGRSDDGDAARHAGRNRGLCGKPARRQQTRRHRKIVQGPARAHRRRQDEGSHPVRVRGRIRRSARTQAHAGNSHAAHRRRVRRGSDRQRTDGAQSADGRPDLGRSRPRCTRRPKWTIAPLVTPTWIWPNI